jgi:putative membrane protein
MKQKVRAIALFAAGALIAAAAWAQSSTSSTHRAKSAAMATFAKNAAIGGMEEVEIGKVAVQNAANARVKEFGQRMIDDHSKANDELKRAADQDGITVPADLDAKHKAEKDKFAKMSGAAFDKAYMADMVRDHKKDVAEFEKAAKHSGDSAVKNFAEKTLPTLREHLKMAEDINKEVGGHTATMHKSTSTSKPSGASE